MIALATPAADAGVSRSVLPNGLTVLSEYVPGVRSVAFGAWVRAGSMHDRVDGMGLAHLLEHMVFKGTARYSAKEIALSLEVLGGSLDAYTTREHTSYQARVLDEHLTKAADVIGDLVFRPLLRATDLKTERKVILEEIASAEDAPDDIVFDLHAERMFPAHPYGYTILGTRETITALQVADLQAVHAATYRPSQVVVAAVGNVTHDALLSTLEETGWFDVVDTASSGVVTPAPVRPAIGRHHVARKDIAQTHVVLAGNAPKWSDTDRHAFSVASALLGGGMSSRLFQKVREDLGLAYTVYAFHNAYRDSGQHGVYLATAPEQVRDAVQVVEQELQALADGALTDEEIALGISQLKGQLVLSLDGLSARLYRAAAVDLYDEPYRPVDVLLQELDAITPDAVRASCAAHLSPAETTLLSLGPTGAA
jgi:predicted Zn-dependent peptidase